MNAKLGAAMCAISTFLTLSPAFGEQASPTPVAAEHTRSNESSTVAPASPRAPRAPTNADRAGYAARESAAPDAKAYQGGDSVVVIGASTVTVILAVILLVVLI